MKNQLISFSILAGVCAVLQAFMPAAPARAGTGTIRGTVSDSLGIPIVGIPVVLPDMRRGVGTDSLGRFTFLAVPAGRHALRLHWLGCMPVTESLTVAADSVSALRIVPPWAPWWTPVPSLPIRPEDRERFPRKGFGFVFETSRGERVDTFKGLVTKDLVCDPDTTIALMLTAAETDSIYQKMLEIRLLELLEPHSAATQPDVTYHLSAQAGSTRRALEWRAGGLGGTPDWRRLYQLIELIRKLVQARPEWRALPAARCGYM